VLVWQAPAPLAALTHVALVYTDGVPALYIDGKKVHTGVASGQTPHLSPPNDEAFAGQNAGAASTAGVFSDADIAVLAERTLAAASSGLRLAPSLVFGPDGALTLETAAPGSYEAALADGTKRAWQVAEPPVRLALDQTPWTVSFQQAPNAAFTRLFDALTDWKDSADARIKYYSGTARYENHFAWSKPRPGSRVWIDLGDVRNIAAVTLNGRDVAVAWKKPFRADITDALRAGENKLEVRVANDWFNRFVGDEQFPDDTGANANGEVTAWPEWLLKNTARPVPQRVTFASRKQVTKDSPLHASGLLGPVTVFEEVQAK